MSNLDLLLILRWEELTQFPWTLIGEVVLRGTAAIAIAGAAAWMMRGASAGARHLIWLAGLVSLAAVPVLVMAFPGWKLLPPLAGGPTPAPAAAAPVAPAVAPSGDEVGADAFLAQPVSETAGTGAVAGGGAGGFNLGWGGLAGLVWGGVAGLLLLRLAAGHVALRLAQRRSHRIDDPGLLGVVTGLREKLGLRQTAQVYWDEGRTMPVTCGVLRNVVILPAGARDWEPAQLRSVLLHELAHAKRRDPAVHLVAQVIRALHWFHPAVWLAAWRLEMERERACDDLALASGAVPAVDYAQHLLNVVSRGRAAGIVPRAGLALGEHAQLKERLGAILADGKRRAEVSWRVGALTLAFAAGLTPPIALLQAAPQEAAPPEAGAASSKQLEEALKDASRFLPDTELAGRIAQYEKAYRLQTRLPELLALLAEAGGNPPGGPGEKTLKLLGELVDPRGLERAGDGGGAPGGIRVWTLPAPDGKAVLEVCEDGLITRVDRRTGTTQWTRTLAAPVTDPVILDRAGLFFSGGDPAMLVCIDHKDGKTLFRIRPSVDGGQLSRTETYPGASTGGREVRRIEKPKRIVAAIPVGDDLDPVAVAIFLGKLIGREATFTADAENRQVLAEGEATAIFGARRMVLALRADARPPAGDETAGDETAPAPAAPASGRPAAPKP